MTTKTALFILKEQFTALAFALLSIGVSLPAIADDTPPRWTGYRSLEEVHSMNLPFEQFAKNSVYLIVTAGIADDLSQAEIVDLQKDPRARETNNDIQFLSKKKNNFNFQIETCRQQGLRYCPVFPTGKQGTAFFNNGKLYTCRHGFHNWLALASKANHKPVNEISPPLIIRKESTIKPGTFQVVYNSGVQNSLKLKTINTDSRLDEIFRTGKNESSINKEFFYRSSDLVTMTFNSDSLLTDSQLKEVSQGQIQNYIGKPIYITGYPRESKHSSPVVLNGNVQNFTSQESIFTSSPSYGGLSGSPLLSQQGELLGMTCFGGESGSVALTIDTDYLTKQWNSDAATSDSESTTVNN